MLENYLVRQVQGRESSHWITKLAPNHYQYAKPAARIALRNGILFDLDISNLLDWCVYFGIKEPARDKLYGLVGPGDCVVDVGVNIGETVTYMAQLVGNSGKIYGFEPDPVNFKIAADAVQRNKMNQVHLEELALSDDEGCYNLYRIDSRNPGANRILPEGNRADAVPVKSILLDLFVKQRQINRIDLIKIDVEGFEYHVLQGARETIARFRPKIFMELNNDMLGKHGHSAQKVVKLMSGWSYQMTRADTGEPVDASYNFAGCHFDLVCI
ncbi:MAG: FkbM family methyltransferase [Myxococcota bacterium]